MNATAMPNVAADNNSARVHLPCLSRRGAENTNKMSAAAMTRNHATLAGAN